MTTRFPAPWGAQVAGPVARPHPALRDAATCRRALLATRPGGLSGTGRNERPAAWGPRDRIDHVPRRCSGPSEWRDVGRPRLIARGNVGSAQAAGQNAGAEVVMEGSPFLAATGTRLVTKRSPGEWRALTDTSSRAWASLPLSAGSTCGAPTSTAWNPSIPLRWRASCRSTRSARSPAACFPATCSCTIAVSGRRRPTTIAFSLDLRPGTAALPGSAHTLTVSLVLDGVTYEAADDWFEDCVQRLERSLPPGGATGVLGR